MRKIYLCVTLCLLAMLTMFSTAQAQVVINEVYGGGGNSGATLKNDFIELYNNSNVAVSLVGWSVQYGSSGGNTWAKTDLSGSIPAHGYYLVQEAAGAGGTVDLPTPDAIGGIAMAAGAGKVALVNSTIALSGTCPTGFIDLVGYGAANCSETNPTTVLSASTSAQRIVAGADANNNSTDFQAAAPTPLNSSNVPNSVSVAGSGNASEPATNGSFTISFGPATAAAITLDYSFSNSATFGTDYTVAFTGASSNSVTASGTLTIPAGTTAVTVTITPINDISIEGTEPISLTISNATGGYSIANAVAAIDLLDDEQAFILLGNSPYNQDFNSLATTGTANTLSLTGWAISETGNGTRDNESYASDNGGSNTGDTYSYGSTASTERALGSLQSGTLISAYGAYFKNNGSSPITSLRVAYTGEQWRLGTTARADALNFQYSLDATDLVTGTWNAVSQLNFASPYTTTIGVRDGNDPVNRSLVDYTITGLNIPVGQTFFIRWSDFNASGADDGLAIDDLSVEANPADLVAPVILSASPANGATDVATAVNASINYNEAILKGSGNIIITNTATSAVFATLDVNSPAVTVTGSSLKFAVNGLAVNTTYEISLPTGIVTDLAANPAAASVSSFTTGTLLYSASFNNCTGAITDGFTQFSQTGTITWGCTTFGHDKTVADGTGDAPYALQINGYVNGTGNVPNIDWLISPAFDLTGTQYPLLSYYSRTAFNGLPLKLMVSTDYVSGDPTLATWTQLNGRFPNQASNVWTLSSGINLEAYKTANVHIAFVYTSTVDDGARWTLDDISLDNSLTPPPPTLSASATDISLGFTAAGSSTDKTFSFIANDLIEPVTLTSTGAFLLSKNGSGFSSSISYSVAEANNGTSNVYVRFSPTVAGQDYTGTITINTTNIQTVVNLTGTSIDPATTLEVVNWNIEWFGSPENGPTNDVVQQQNVSTIMMNVGADVFALEEVVDESKLAAIVANMPGYAYTISNYGSHTNTVEQGANAANSLALAQKLAFVYKTSLLSNISTEALLSAGINSAADLSNPSYDYWASGRFPYMMKADVTLNCVTKTVRFVVVHAKANTSPTTTSYIRRENGADTLYKLLEAQYPQDNIIILGDFNDDFDQSITAGFTTPSWNIFNLHPENFSIPTLPLSLAGKKSTVSYNDMIDHVVVSDNMAPYYMSSSATVLSDVTSLVTNYGSTTTDHYPIFTRYRFENPTVAPSIVCSLDTAFCANSSGNYNVLPISATAGCSSTLLSYDYSISGATQRSGTGADASGSFNTGTSTIAWTVTDTYGNQAACSTSVVIKTPPVVSIPDAYALPVGVAPNTVYIGYAPAKSLTLTATSTGGTPGYSYSWSNGINTASTTVTPLTNTIYTVIATDASGCTGTASKMVAVADVRAGKNLDKVSVCHENGSLEIEIASPAVNTHLNHGDMLGSCVVAGHSITMQAAKAVPQEMQLLGVQASPNPSTAHFTLSIQSANLLDPINLRVFDANGKQIDKLVKPGGNQTVSIGGNYLGGFYFAEVSQGSERHTIKLMKQ